MKITTVMEMDIKTAVDYAVNEIRLGTFGFVIPTEFGRIPVEVVRARPIFDVTTACQWDESPSSEFVMRNRTGDYQWYVKIRYINGMDPILLRIQLIRELSTVMYWSLSTAGRTLDQHLVNALTREYVLSFHCHDHDINRSRFINAYTKVHGGMAVRLSKTASQAIKGEMTRAFDAEETISRHVNNELMRKYRELGFYHRGFGNSFYDLMAASLAACSEIDREKYEEMSDGNETISAYNLIKRITK